MPILSCTIPAFPLALIARAEPTLLERPLALHDPQERVLVATASACRAGVQIGQNARQARIACPELDLRPADLPQARTEFEALLTVLDDYSDAVEPASLGRAYLAAPDLRDGGIVPFCQEIGRRVRQDFGEALQPAIGCDQGKFTAHAAARHTRPGAVRVILGEAERPFLRPLSVTLLPLPAERQRFLGYLGIRTLGQFADLPQRAVFQQFGKPGRLAQHWARGEDTRPVLARSQRPIFTRAVDFDPPLVSTPPLIANAERLLSPLLSHLQNSLQAAQALGATLLLDDGAQHTQDWRLSAPATDLKRFLHLLTNHWQNMTWERPASTLTLSLSDIQEAPGDQLLLFPGEGAPGDLLGELISQMRLRYGAGRLLSAEVPDPLRLWVEKRAHWQEFAL
ncbi:MAG: hypothetical protein GY759_18975 [Chloroflexi bacterium]|nr:hypothetical protein [Chloroflexota bacterium]